MWLLAVETSGRGATVALANEGAIVVERELSEAGRRHAQTLLAEIDSLCRDAGMSPRALDAIGVSIGPGSFTGLRVGVVFAKLFSYATGAPVVAVDTLEAVVETCPPGIMAAWVLSDAQRGDVYAARYMRGDSGLWSRDGEIQIVPAERWLAERSAGEVVTGPGAARLSAELARRGLTLLPEPLQHPRAASVARIAMRMLAEGRTADPWPLEPFYLRKPAAEENAIASGAGAS